MEVSRIKRLDADAQAVDTDFSQIVYFQKLGYPGFELQSHFDVGRKSEKCVQAFEQSSQVFNLKKGGTPATKIDGVDLLPFQAIRLHFENEFFLKQR
jgi:hypothetical protein